MFSHHPIIGLRHCRCCSHAYFTITINQKTKFFLRICFLIPLEKHRLLGEIKQKTDTDVPIDPRPPVIQTSKDVFIRKSQLQMEEAVSTIDLKRKAEVCTNKK